MIVPIVPNTVVLDRIFIEYIRKSRWTHHCCVGMLSLLLKDSTLPICCVYARCASTTVERPQGASEGRGPLSIKG